jgi:hypothetical protein
MMINNPWENIIPPNKDVSARLIDHTHNLDLFWARDYLGKYLFIYEFPPTDKKLIINLPDLVGLQTAFIHADNQVTLNRLILRLNEQSNWELFYTLCLDLVQATRKAQTSGMAVDIILRRLFRWHDFLKKNRNEQLTEEKIKGLIGELYFIKNHLSPVFGLKQSILFWQGPEGLPQDFNVNNSAIEIKCQAGSTSPYVRITSGDQLCPQLPEMYLHVITLGKTSRDNENAINLPILVAFIKRELLSEDPVVMEHFNDFLYLLGYIDSDYYLDFSYILSSEKTYHITDGFPRICSQEIHSGITRVTYEISLNECDQFIGKPDWMG